MNAKEFDRWLPDLEASFHGVSHAFDEYIPQIKKIMDASTLPGGSPSHSASASLIFSKLTSALQMAQFHHDKVLAAIQAD